MRNRKRERERLKGLSVNAIVSGGTPIKTNCYSHQGHSSVFVPWRKIPLWYAFRNCRRVHPCPKRLMVVNVWPGPKGGMYGEWERPRDVKKLVPEYLYNLLPPLKINLFSIISNCMSNDILQESQRYSSSSSSSSSFFLFLSDYNLCVCFFVAFFFFRIEFSILL